jgi:hypothetical protein
MLSEISDTTTGFAFWFNSLPATTLEPIQCNATEESWRKECLCSLGYCQDEELDAAWALNTAKREEYKTDWHFIIFTVRDVCDLDHSFADGTGSFVREIHGPYLVLPFENGGWTHNCLDVTTRHEAAHVFVAADEYVSSLCSTTLNPCGHDWGYLHVANGNCGLCTSTPEPCIMNEIDLQLQGLICPWTQGQIGWRDSDGDGFLDPIDHPDGGRKLAAISTNDPVFPGDVIDIFSTQGQGTWVKRLPMTERTCDNTLTMWDGISAYGEAQSTGQFSSQVNGQSAGYPKLLYGDIQ